MENRPTETNRLREDDSRDDADSEAGRAVSPVIGTVLMVVLTVLLASVVSAGLFSTSQELEEPDIDAPTETVSANPWIGDLGGLVQLSDDTAGATDVSYRVNFTIAEGSDTIGNSLNSVKLQTKNTSPDMFSDTSQSSVIDAYVDTDGDGEPDQDLADDVNGWSTSNGGSTVKIEFSGGYTAQASHSIIITFDGVDNPDNTGTYTLEAQTSGDGNWQQGTIEIVAG